MAEARVIKSIKGVKKGDTVKVLSGKDRGKTGRVLHVHPAVGTVVIEGVNIAKKHTKPTRQMPQGGVIEQPAPLATGKVMVVCPQCGEASRVGFDRDEESVVRVCKSCGRNID